MGSTKSLIFPLLLAALGCGGAKVPEGAKQVAIALSVQEMDLPNGLHVVFHPVPTAPGTLVHVRYEVGSKDDPQGRAGFAHFFEHLMFRGSRYTTAHDYQQWISEVGGDANAATDLDETDYFEVVPTAALPRALWLESDRMAYPLASLDQAGFVHERDVVKNEARERQTNAPLGNLETFARQALYGKDHPYGTPTVGFEGELDAITLAEANAFARRFYSPVNATLVLAGAFEPGEARTLVERYFATIAPGVRRPARPLANVPLASSARLAVEASVEGPAVMVAWRAPREHGDGMEELAFGVDEIEGRINYRLLGDKKIAHGVDVYYQRGELGGLVVVLARLNAGASTAEALTVIDDEVDTASRLGLQYSYDFLPTRKTMRVVRDVEALETLEGRADRLLDDLRWHGRVNSVQGDLKRMQAIHAADVGAAVGQFLKSAPRVTIAVVPRADAPPAGRLVGSP